jgi:hypothetical protein
MKLEKWGTARGKRIRVKGRGEDVVVEAPRPL